jgi:hypothetical protein
VFVIGPDSLFRIWDPSEFISLELRSIVILYGDVAVPFLNFQPGETDFLISRRLSREAYFSTAIEPVLCENY